jgi:NAD(P)-dependent dehydrogenase (short-subunit alcohol dehydrogenase family)
MFANIIQDDALDVELMKCDLASLQSTKAFIEAFKAKYKRLNVLICNAGVYSSFVVLPEIIYKKGLKISKR